MLWDKVSAVANDRRLSRSDFWSQVSAELGSHIKSSEIRLKWMSLRCTYNKNRTNLLRKKKAYGATSPVVAWRYFNQMKFLDTIVNITASKSAPASPTLESVILFQTLIAYHKYTKLRAGIRSHRRQFNAGRRVFAYCRIIRSFTDTIKLQ